MIGGTVVLLCCIELTTVVCHRMEAGLSRLSLEKDSAQGLRAGIGVKFHHGVYVSIVSRIGAVQTWSFSASKARCWSSPHSKGEFFRVS